MTRRTTHRISPIAAAVILTAIVLAGCADGIDQTNQTDQTDDAQIAAVEISTFIFDPDPVRISAGDTVEFENLDNTVHTVTAGTRESPAPELFDESLARGEATRWTFDEPGTYDYFCRLHSGPGMTGQVIVTGD